VIDWLTDKGIVHGIQNTGLLRLPLPFAVGDVTLANLRTNVLKGMFHFLLFATLGIYEFQG
jgi:hypothetical protein